MKEGDREETALIPAALCRPHLYPEWPRSKSRCVQQTHDKAVDPALKKTLFKAWGYGLDPKEEERVGDTCTRKVEIMINPEVAAKAAAAAAALERWDQKSRTRITVLAAVLHPGRGGCCSGGQKEDGEERQATSASSASSTNSQNLAETSSIAFVSLASARFPRVV